MRVRKESHYGVEVSVSVDAEETRKTACLCVHKEGDKTVMCKHLLANLAFEESMFQKNIKNIDFQSVAKFLVQKDVIARAIEEFPKKFSANNHFNPISQDGVCLIALINYAVCLKTNAAMAVTRCPWYEEPENAEQEKFPPDELC